MPSSISSRTPEGLPSDCPVCGAATEIEFSEPPGDACCPACGCLLWRSAEAYARLCELIAEKTGVPADEVSYESVFKELGADSLDTVELVMELEEEFDVQIPPEVLEKFESVADAVRWIEEQRRKEEEPDESDDDGDDNPSDDEDDHHKGR